MKVLGIILIIFGIVAGIHAGFWWALVGGTVQIIAQIGVTPIVATEVATGLLKIIFSALIGGAAAFVPVFLGISLLKD